MTTTSLESDRLSTASEFAIIEPAARLDYRQSIVASSEMSFGMDIPSLGDSGESVEASTSAVVMGLIDALGKQDGAGLTMDAVPQPDPLPAPSATVPNDSVMSFDDSDIEEVVLT